jgi:hypothetical protein
MHFTESVFEAVVDTEVVIFRCTQPMPEHVVKIAISNGITSIKSYSTPQTQWNEFDGRPINIFHNSHLNDLVAKIRKWDKLDPVCKITQGAKPFQVGKGKPPQTRSVVSTRFC